MKDTHYTNPYHLYTIANHCFAIGGERLTDAIAADRSFTPFRTDNTPEGADNDTEGRKTDFTFTLTEDDAPTMEHREYEMEHEGCMISFGSTTDGYLLHLYYTGDKGVELLLWSNTEERRLWLRGDLNTRMLRFAMWTGYGLMTAGRSTIAIHSSCIVADGRAVLFLGESGTGKSTHTRLWREHIEGATLLNDDSPIIRIDDNGQAWAYGSPWSGKTACYRAERFPLAACVRLSQAKENTIRRLTTIQAYAAIHPSCPPEFAYDKQLYDNGIANTMERILTTVPVYHLGCLPDCDAARLAYNTTIHTLPNSSTHD